MEEKLTTALKPSQLAVEDDSAQHHGHAHEGAGHYTVHIASPLFTNQSLVQCHRLVYSALDDLMKNAIHALRIKILKN